MALGLPASQKTCWSNVRNIPHNDKMHRISVQTLVTQTVWHYSYRSDSDRYGMVPGSFNSIEKSVDGQHHEAKETAVYSYGYSYRLARRAQQGVHRASTVGST